MQDGKLGFMINGVDAGWAFENEEFTKGVLFPTVCVYDDGC